MELILIYQMDHLIILTHLLIKLYKMTLMVMAGLILGYTIRHLENGIYLPAQTGFMKTSLVMMGPYLLLAILMAMEKVTLVSIMLRLANGIFMQAQMDSIKINLDMPERSLVFGNPAQAQPDLEQHRS